VLFEVIAQIFESFDVSVHAFRLGVRNKDYPIHPAENQLAAGIVKDLSGNGIEMETSLESADCSEI
jgi:hypothetical protein